MKSKFQLFNIAINTFIKDLQSFRIQLVYWAIIINLLMMYLVAFKGVDYKAFVASFGALTLCYGFYFQSKEKQSNHEHELKLNQQISADDVLTERDPDEEV